MKFVSKNCYIENDSVETIDELEKLSNNRESIYHKHLGIKPASVIMSMQCRMVCTMIKNNSLIKVVNINRNYDNKD